MLDDGGFIICSAFWFEINVIGQMDRFFGTRLFWQFYSNYANLAIVFLAVA